MERYGQEDKVLPQLWSRYERGGRMIVDGYTRELQEQSIKQKTKPLGEELRKVREGITDEKVLIGFNMAIAICNKYLAESENKE